MRNNRSWAWSVLGLLACSSQQSPGARIALDVSLPESPLTGMRNVSLLAAGDGFILAGFEDDKVRWARASRAGVLSSETPFTLDSAPVLGPYFAATQKAAPADQLIVIGLYQKTPASAGYELRAIAQDLGSGAKGATEVYDTFAADTDTTAVQIAAGTALSGSVGFMAWATKGEGTPIKYRLLGADAALRFKGTVFDVPDPSQQPAWDCLAATPGPTGMGFSVTTPDPTCSECSSWHTFDLDPSGAPAEAEYGLSAQVTDCGIVGSPTPTGGYDMAFRNIPGIGIAFYYPPADADLGVVMPYSMAIPAAKFGSPAMVPRPVWATAAGNDITVGLANSSAVQVMRFSYQSLPRGSSLVLPSASGNIGPAAAWVGSDSVYVTYADFTGSGATASVKRHFTVVEAPAELP
jgi:hypothetical protein